MVYIFRPLLAALVVLGIAVPAAAQDYTAKTEPVEHRFLTIPITLRGTVSF